MEIVLVAHGEQLLYYLRGITINSWLKVEKLVQELHTHTQEREMIFIVTEVQISEVTFSFEALCLLLQLSNRVLVADTPCGTQRTFTTPAKAVWPLPKAKAACLRQGGEQKQVPGDWQVQLNSSAPHLNQQIKGWRWLWLISAIITDITTVKADCQCQILELGLKELNILKYQSPKTDKSPKAMIYFILFLYL